LYIKKQTNTYRRKTTHISIAPAKGAETPTPWIEAEATWRSDNINTWRGSIEEMRERVEMGPTLQA